MSRMKELRVCLDETLEENQDAHVLILKYKSATGIELSMDNATHFLEMEKNHGSQYSQD